MVIGHGNKTMPRKQAPKVTPMPPAALEVVTHTVFTTLQCHRLESFLDLADRFGSGLADEFGSGLATMLNTTGKPLSLYVLQAESRRSNFPPTFQTSR